tara:strand:+ start:6518 stop:7312 length:795 start_codon:yes stop_codon:yes gene_type:complete
MLKFKIPFKNDKYLENFFKKINLHIIVKNYLTNKQSLDYQAKNKVNKNSCRPILYDLYKIYFVIRKLKRITCLEFGTGWSTLVMSIALEENKKEFWKDIKKLRFSHPFELHTVDNLKKSIETSRKRILNYSNRPNNTKFYYSKNKVTLFNQRFANEYVKLPSINPDFIYIDGPHSHITDPIRNIRPSFSDFMPMNIDVIKIEYFLTPGTIIFVNGRSSNCNFLRDNLKRNWQFVPDIKGEHTLFILNEKPLGKFNQKQLEFYKN